MPGRIIESNPLNSFYGKDFEDQGEVGWGFSGLVLKSLHRPTDRILARKIIHETPRKRREMATCSNSGGREMEFFVRMREDCENVVKCFGTLPVGGHGHIHGGLVFEFMDLGSLADFLTLNRHRALPEPIILYIAHNLLKACSQLEDVGIVHRDIKPSNLLFDSRGGVKLCDFGEACYRWESEDEACQEGRMAGSTAYMSPERLAGLPHSHPADIWSVGLLLLELTCKAFPFALIPDEQERGSSTPSSDCSIIELWETVMETDPLPQVDESIYSSELAKLVELCMKKDPNDRPDAKLLLRDFSELLESRADPETFVEFIKRERARESAR